MTEGNSRDAPPITAIVAACDEAHLLPACLEGLAFCDEVIVVDLESTDGSGDVARRLGARVIPHARVPIVEQVRSSAAAQARNDWILFVDPDEVVPESLGASIQERLGANPRLACVRLPVAVYFRGQPLRYSVWGRPDQGKYILVHRFRVHLPSRVHASIEPLQGFETAEIRAQGDAHIHHYWARSYRGLIRKHLRYIHHEGEARYARGERFSWMAAIRQTAGAAKVNLLEYGGLRGGPPGIFLSFFHAWYVCMGWLALRRYEHDAQSRDS
jgi:glycosyltransferase involved in cell wall biosynthesis